MSGQRVVQMTRLGAMGRFANQVFQYGHLRVQAARHGAAVEVPRWVGERLFGHRDARPSRQLPPYQELYAPCADRRSGCVGAGGGQPVPPQGDECVGRDYVGWAQFHTSWLRSYRDLWRSLFVPVEEVRARVAPAFVRMADRGQTIVGVHLRRGDYGQSIFPIVPVEWYQAKLAELWPTLYRPCLFVATEDASLVEAFAQYRPATVRDLGVDLQSDPIPEYNYLPLDTMRRDPVQMDFYPDFWMLSKCDVLLIPNSTFSFAAAMLSHGQARMLRASLRARGFVLEDPWDAYPLQHDDVRDFPDVPGIALPSNEYW